MKHGPVVVDPQDAPHKSIVANHARQSCQEALVTADAEDSADECESRRLIMESISVRHASTGRLGRFVGLAALAFVLGATVLVKQSRGTGVKSTPSEKPFRLYDGGLDMPGRADQYDGIDDTRGVNVEDNDGSASVFAIGDWGAVLPDHCTFAAAEGEQDAQYRVADQVKSRAWWANPQYVLNVGDNFYVDGLHTSCNNPPSDDQGATEEAFRSGWSDIYGQVADVPWLGVLGNHDYGGWRF